MKAKKYLIIFLSIVTIPFFYSGYKLNKVEKTQLPKFVKGVFINSTKNLTYKAQYFKSCGINTFVIDAYKLKLEDVLYLNSQNIHLISRVSVFPDGLKVFPAPKWMIKKAIMLAQHAEDIGVRTIQLDYIRFTDSSYYHRYKQIPEEQIIKDNYIIHVIRTIKTSVSPNIRFQADVFGRIPFTKYDRIGQNFNMLDKEVDDICPMAYPSYFVHRKVRMNKEYHIIKRSARISKRRANNSRVILWIQGWRQSNISHRSFTHFVYNQVAAAKKYGSNGFIMWNAGSQYSTLKRVLQTKSMIAMLDN